MGIADHRNCALAEDRNPAWMLPDPVEDNETEAEAFAGLSQCNSLLTMGGSKPKKKKRPVLLLDPEEAAKAHSEMALTAAQDFADPERATARQPSLGLSAADANEEQNDPVAASDDWRKWAERGPAPLSTQSDTGEFLSASRGPAPVADPQGKDATVRPEVVRDSFETPRTKIADVTPGKPVAPMSQRGGSPLSGQPVSYESAIESPSRPERRSSRFVEVPFEEELPAPSETIANPAAITPEPAPERNTLRRNLQVQPTRSETAVPSFAGLLTRLRSAIERLTRRR